MRCDEVKRELSAPGGGPDRPAMAAHLSGCPSCADWSESVRHLDRIWAASRPPEPPPGAFEAVWSRVTAEVEAGQAVGADVIPFSGISRRKRWLLATVAVAQAAAIVLGAFALPLAQPHRASAQIPTYAIEEGTTLIVKLNGRNEPVVLIRPEKTASDTDTVSVELDVLNFMESVE